jgi:transcription initiation factor TFIIIB Brf1 subunit/transcription initiation factor TFIIB
MSCPRCQADMVFRFLDDVTGATRCCKCGLIQPKDIQTDTTEWSQRFDHIEELLTHITASILSIETFIKTTKFVVMDGTPKPEGGQ